MTDHVRFENDAFYTEPALTQALVARLIADKWIAPPTTHHVLEPSVGRGGFAFAVRDQLPGAFITGVDIDPACEARCGALVQKFVCTDFLTYVDSECGFDLVIGNPPFAKAVEGRVRPEPVAEKHVRRALNWRAPHGVAAFLLRSAFAESVERIPFWIQHPASKVFALAERPSFTGNGKTDKGQSYSMFVWKLGHRGPTEYENFSWRKTP